jgi:hypothetical protein
MSDHWYGRDGSPCYEVPNKSGGGFRSTTLADARKLGLVPSVTTVLQVLAKPGLERWKIRQGVLAALTLPIIEGESSDAWLARIDADAEKQSKDAADEGTRIHDAIERSFRGMVVEDRYRPHVAGARAEISRLFPDVDDWVVEASFASERGFGGKVDLHSPSTGIVIDHKGKDGECDDSKKHAHDQHYQLAAYSRGLGLPISPCANLFMSRTHPGKCVMHVWTPDEIEHGWQVFVAALDLWRAIKRYDPRFTAAALAA